MERFIADGTFKVRVTLDLDVFDGWDVQGRTREEAVHNLRERVLELLGDRHTYAADIPCDLRVSDHHVVVTKESICVKEVGV